MESAELHQTLHGYAAGHRLLAASLELPTEAREVLAALSDLSGRRVSSGFESYLTGYPLPATEYFVFARTWLALEMPRPGCVWTHSLLIPFAALDRFRSLSGLSKLHVRPRGEEGGTRLYSETLRVSIDKLAGEWDPVNLECASVFRHVLRALYATNERIPVVISAVDPQRAENGAVALWTQQWGSMRRAFRFCTGALSPRTIYGELFDLQIMPPQAARLLRHDKKRLVSVVEQVGVPTIPYGASDDAPTRGVAPSSLNEPNWIEPALRDLMDPRPSTQFREWLSMIGLSADDGSRASASFYFGLAAQLAEQPPRVREMLTDLAQRYPESGMGEGIKTAILGRGSKLSDGEVLTGLAITHVSEAFDSSHLDVWNRANQFWRERKPDARKLLELLIQQPLTEVKTDILLGLCGGMSQADAFDTVLSGPGFILPVLSAHPQLLSDPRVWQMPQEAFHELVKAVRTMSAERRPAAETLFPAVLNVPAEGVDALVEAYRGSLLDAILKTLSLGVLSQRQFVELASRASWAHLIRNHHDVMRAWLGENPPSLPIARVLAELLQPNDFAVVPLSHWLDIYLSMEARNDVMLSVQLFSVAMLIESRDSGRLAGRTLPTVHDVVIKGLISEPGWAMLATNLPQVTMWLSDDRAERLRRAYVDAFVTRRPWLFVDFVAGFDRDVNALDLACAYARKSERGRSFLKRLANAVKKGRVTVTPTQREIILDNTRKRLSDFFSLD